jgi:hypothetical protein
MASRRGSCEQPARLHQCRPPAGTNTQPTRRHNKAGSAPRACCMMPASISASRRASSGSTCSMVTSSCGEASGRRHHTWGKHSSASYWHLQAAPRCAVGLPCSKTSPPQPGHLVTLACSVGVRHADERRDVPLLPAAQATARDAPRRGRGCRRLGRHRRAAAGAVRVPQARGRPRPRSVGRLLLPPLCGAAAVAAAGRAAGIAGRAVARAAAAVAAADARALS